MQRGSRMLLYVGRCCQQQSGAKKRTSQSEGCNQDRARRAIVFHAFAIKACVAQRSMINVERYAPNTNNGKLMPGESFIYNSDVREQKHRIMLLNCEQLSRLPLIIFKMRARKLAATMHQMLPIITAAEAENEDFTSTPVMDAIKELRQSFEFARGGCRSAWPGFGISHTSCKERGWKTGRALSQRDV
jgi:hypothetical protein